MEFDADELHVIRQWFSGIQDLNPEFLEPKDFVLIYKIYKKIGWKIPDSISKELNKIAEQLK